MPPRKKTVTVEGAATSGAESQAPAASSSAPNARSAKSQLGALFADELVAGALKKFGKNTLLMGSELKARKISRIPTGIFPLDLALYGGWAVGGVHTLTGHKSAGKTTTLYRTLGEAQKCCANCWDELPACKCGDTREPVMAYIDVEGAMDAQWASRFVNLDDMMVTTPEYAEQTITIAEALLRSRKCDILVIDSLAFMTPAKEIEEAVEKDLMGVQARVLGKGVRKFVAALNDAMTSDGKRPTVFLTNQIRMKLGVMFGNPETNPGGLAPGFAAWTEARMKPGKFKMDDNGELALYGDFGFSIDKAKNSPPKTSFEYRMMLVETDTKKPGDIYDEDFILAHAERHGLVTGGGSSWNCLNENYRKKSDIEQRLLTDRDFHRTMRTLLLDLVRPLPNS